MLSNSNSTLECPSSRLTGPVAEGCRSRAMDPGPVDTEAWRSRPRGAGPPVEPEAWSPSRGPMEEGWRSRETGAVMVQQLGTNQR